MNNFIEKFWLIFEPVLSALVVENLDNYITDYLPSFLDSIRLSTFTLGSKPFRVETIKTYADAEPDTVSMDCKVSFISHDLSDLSSEELNSKVNPKIIMQVRFGGRRVGAGFPVLLEDLTFAGHLRVKIKLMSRYPFMKTLEVSFLDKPEFDYVLKPLGTDTFGLDVNFIPGLQSFIREQVHNILGPLMYAPNVLTVDAEKVLAGDFDFSSANGLLAVTVYSAERIKNIDDLVDEAPNPYVRFYLDHGQELDRTSVCENTYSPVWNETRYLKLNNLNSLLSMELKTSRNGFKDRRLATANFDLSQLDDESQAEQEGLNLLLLRNGKHVSDLRVDIRYLPISKSTKRDDGTIEPAVDSNSGVLRLVIHECRDLQSLHGSISPFVRIIVNGVEKKKTAVMKNKRDPKYEEPYEIVVLDKTSFFIRAEIIDHANNDKLLGTFTSYLSDMMQLQTTNSSWWKLMHEDKQVGELRLSAEWKPVMMTGLSDIANIHGFDQAPIGAIRFTFWEARDLRNAGMGGKSDPYIRVLSGSQIRARTEVVENNLNPEWGASLYVPVHSLKEIFVLEAMDWNAKSKDKSLGMTEFKASEIIQQQIGNQSVNPDVWYEANAANFNKRSTKGELHFSAEFFPVLTLPNTNDTHNVATVSAMPLRGLHGSYIRYTPDDLVDLGSYNSGVLKIKIMDVQLSSTAYCYCQVIVDSLMPCYKTAKLRGFDLKFDEYADAFIKEADFSRIAIEVKPAHSTEKDIHKLGHWIDSGSAIIRRIMKRKRLGLADDDEGTWFNLIGTDGPARIKLSFRYDPMESFVLNPDESLDNQGNLTVDLLSAKNLMAADKSGTSDPYVVFTVNGEKVHKSETIKKTLNPKWRNERFTVPIQSRVTASIRIEVFDWNQVKGHTSIGSGGITLRGDAVESFGSRLVDIPLDGIAGVSGTVQVRFTWQPQLLASNKRQKTSVLATTRTYLHDDVNLEASGPLIRDSRLTVGTESNQSRASFDDNASISALSFADTAALSDATGKPGIVTITLIEARGLRGPFVFDFKVKDHNKFKSSVDLGHSTINIWDLIKPDLPGGDTFSQWLPLFPPGSGEIAVHVQFKPTM
ncbi:C2 domain-containing protein [Mycotypha africana]|uniref:C2 domain-containing protein n=1 Tax=Mycotypha africana TaxID=64632 RepID=UPI002301F705|nr:C2 domain-containing protein [Mycotypha africana]KAI8987617.1 C2 domain-containing protein [Mycotypha africana]